MVCCECVAGRFECGCAGVLALSAAVPTRKRHPTPVQSPRLSVPASFAFTPIRNSLPSFPLLGEVNPCGFRTERIPAQGPRGENTGWRWGCRWVSTAPCSDCGPVVSLPRAEQLLQDPWLICLSWALVTKHCLKCGGGSKGLAMFFLSQGF